MIALINLKGLKLKQQLGILIGIAVVLMILVQLVYYFRFHDTTRNKAIIYAGNTISQIEENLAASTNSVYKSGFTVAYNKYVQEYLVTSEPLRRIELNGYITDLIRNIFIPTAIFLISCW